MTATLLDPRLHLDTGGHDRFAHLVDRDKVTDAYVFGHEIDALCGKRWVPSADPDRYPICPSCTEALRHLAAGRDTTGSGKHRLAL